MSCPHFNDYASIHPTSSTREEFDGYQLLDQTPAAQDVNYQGPHNTFTDFWGTFEQSGLMDGSTTTLPSMAGHEPLTLATPYTNQTDGYSQPSYPSNHWPEIGWQGHDYHSGSSSQEISSAVTAVTEPVTTVPTMSNVPLGYWGETQNEQSIGMSYPEDIYNYHQPGPTETGQTQTGWFQPYGMSRAPLNEHWDAEVGQSSLVPPPIPYVGSPTQQPSGGYTSETTANAETNNSIKEGDKVTTPKPTRVKGPPRLHRVEMEEGITKVCNWVRRRDRLTRAPIINTALEALVKKISATRPPVYSDHCLIIGRGSRKKAGSRGADGEFRRRNAERELYMELSRYYLLEQNHSAWARAKLLSRAVEELQASCEYDLSVPPGPFGQPSH